MEHGDALPEGSSASAGYTRRDRQAWRQATLVAAVAGLVIVVAAASTAARPESRPATSSNPRWVLDTAGSVAGVFIVFSLIVLLTGLRPGRKMDDDTSDSEGRRQRSWERLLGMAVGWLCLLLITWTLLGHGRLQRTPHTALPRPTAPSAPDAPSPSSAPPPERVFDPWVAAAATTATFAVAGTLAAASRRRRRRRTIGPDAGPGPGRTAAAAAMVDDSLAAIAAEPDPRRAVIAAYASMERSLGRLGVPPEPWETPFEYLDRVLVAFGAGAATAATLTRLFEHARFGSHAVLIDRRDEAVDALATLRTEIAPAP